MQPSNVRRRRPFQHGCIVEPCLENGTLDIKSRALALNVILLYGFGLTGYLIPNRLGPYIRGFFCDDDAIRYNYKKETISANLMLVLSLAVIFVSIIFTEFLRIRSVEENISLPKYRWRNSHIHVLIVRIATYIGYSQIGFMCTVIVTEVTKMMVGELRPHFYDVCQPANGTCIGKEHVYISNYTCTGDPVKILEARKSFLSGHSAISMYCFVFSALYIQARLQPILQNRVFVPLSQTAFMLTALSIAYTRISDHFHHPIDVAFGILLGLFMAIYTVIFWARLFDNNDEEETKPLLINRRSLSNMLNRSHSSNSSMSDGIEQLSPLTPSPGEDRAFAYDRINEHEDERI